MEIEGMLFNERWWTGEDGGRYMVKASAEGEMLTSPYGNPILGWAAYEIKDGKKRFYGDISCPLEFAIRFLRGEEVEVLT